MEGARWAYSPKTKVCHQPLPTHRERIPELGFTHGNRGRLSIIKYGQRLETDFFFFLPSTQGSVILYRILWDKRVLAGCSGISCRFAAHRRVVFPSCTAR